MTDSSPRAGLGGSEQSSSAAEFARAVSPHFEKMGRLAVRLGPRDAHDDIVQEALFRAWRHRDQFDDQRGSLAVWLLAIVANEARRLTHRRLLPLQVRAAFQASTDDRLDVEAAVRRLPRRQRLAIDCFYYVGLSVAETAAVMRCSQGTVKSSLSDARRRLRTLLEAPK